MTNLQFKGKSFFAFVVLLYIVLSFIDYENTIAALHKSSYVLIKLIPIFLFVILLTSIINYFLQPKQIAKHVGKESGFMGWFYSLFAGVLSHGPMYAWYPMIQDMKKHGLKDGLIATFFYARAIKLPLLPLMIDYFGVLFAFVLSFYILLGAFVQGKVIDYWFREQV